MIDVSSMFRTKDGLFVPIENRSNLSMDDDYIDGAIRLTINGVPVLDEEVWDYVDELWVHIASALEELKNTGRSTAHFPDQPLEISFRRIGGRDPRQVHVSLNTESAAGLPRRAVVDENELLAALRSSGLSFFAAIADISPEKSQAFAIAERKLKAL